MHTPKQSLKYHLYLQVLHSFVYYTYDRSSSSPLSAGLNGRVYPRSTSLWGCLQDKATATHSAGGCGMWNSLRIKNWIFKHHSPWWGNTTTTPAGKKKQPTTYINRMLVIFLRDWKCSPATNFSRSERYKCFTYKYLYQLCRIGFASRNALVRDLCLSLRLSSLQSIKSTVHYEWFAMVKYLWQTKLAVSPVI